MLNDLRLAFRSLSGQPGFTLVAVASLALGIGANTGIYSFADGLLLRPLPVTQASRIVDIASAAPHDALGAFTALSYPDYVDVRDRSRSFDGLIAMGLAPFGLAPDRKTQPRSHWSAFVSGNFFDVLQVKPQIGRAFTPAEDRVPGRDAVMILSHDVWVSDLASDPGVIGRKLWLNGMEFTVVGVAPESFPGIGDVKTGVYVPLAMSSALWTPDVLTDRSHAWLSVRGRLHNGVGIAAATADVARISADLRRAYPHTDGALRLKAETELRMRIEANPPNAALIFILGSLALAVLGIACANVAGLLVSRSTGRAREIAVRLAIGGSRRQIVRQLLIENSLLAVAGGVAGLSIGYAVVVLFDHVPLPTDTPLNIYAQLDSRALLFTLAVSAISTLLFGLAPALRSTRLDLNAALKEKASTGSRSARFWGRRMMVSAQVAMSLVLLIVSAVLVRGFASELQRGPGFKIDRLQTMSAETSLLHYDDAHRERFYRDWEQNARTLPGVEDVALAAWVPLGFSNEAAGILPEGQHLKKGEPPPSIPDNVVTPSFFKVVGIPIVSGRGFDLNDKAGSPLVAIVNQQFVHHYWPHEQPLGKILHLSDNRQARVVGVAKNSKYFWIAEGPIDFVYFPVAQEARSGLTLFAKSRGPDPSSLAPALIALVHRLDPNMPVSEVRTMQSLFHDRAVTTPNLLITLVSSMGFLALILSCIGLYGVVSYSVSRRTREFGVRMAVGARSSQIAGLVLREALWLGMAGVAVGLLLGIVVAEAVRSQILFAFQSTGPMPYAIVCVLLILTVCLAGYVPASRASRTDPLRALREE